MKKLTNREIGVRLKQSRADKGYTMQQVAELVGVDRSTVQRYEVGGIVIIKRPVVESICKCLGVNPGWVLGESENKYLTEADALSDEVLFVAKRLQALPQDTLHSVLKRLHGELDAIEQTNIE